MICDTTFLSDLLRERADGRPRGAQAFLAAHRNQPFLTTVISVGEAAAMYANSEDVRPLIKQPFFPGPPDEAVASLAKPADVKEQQDDCASG